MKRHLGPFCWFLALLPLFLVQCSDDKSPLAPVPTPSTWGKILLTSAQEGVIGGDTTDWCPAAIPAKGGLPDEYALYAAFPNPAIDSVTILYDLPAQSDVHVAIIDSLDVVRRVLVTASQVAGSYRVVWRLDDDSGVALPPGTYRCRFEAGSFSCAGDIEILPSARNVFFYTFWRGDTLITAYVSREAVGGIALQLIDTGPVGLVTFGPVTSGMLAISIVRNDTLQVMALPDIANPHIMRPGTFLFARIPISSDARIVAKEASDSIGYIIPSVIRAMEQ